MNTNIQAKQWTSTPIRILLPNGLAVSQREFLFAGLENFVNLDNRLEDFVKFGAQWPSFFPARIGALEGGRITIDEERGDVSIKYRWAPEAHSLVLAYRWLLRRIWHHNSRGQNYLGVLMGIDHAYLNGVEDGELGNGTVRNLFSEGWRKLKIAFPEAQQQGLPSVFPSWPSGAFFYTPLNDFQKALYLLFRESWRAKICHECQRCFIAQKPAQGYCSPRCSGAAKKRRNLDWWRREGAAQRQASSAKVKRTHPRGSSTRSAKRN